MRRIIIVAVLVLSCVLQSLAAQEPVELTDWWSIEAVWSFGRDFSYLPDFDTANNGVHSLAIYTRRNVDDDSSSTWYNRYYMDTVNQFHWPSGEEFTMATGDFNNDGAVDYLTYRGFIYQGIENGRPPSSTPVAEYPSAAVAPSDNRFVVDVNSDGNMDVINPKSSEGGNFLFSLMIGNNDLTKLKVVYIHKRPDYGYGEYFLGALSKQPGDTTVKIVNMSYELFTVDGSQRVKWYAFVLREMKVEKVGDTVNISFTTLDSLWFKGYESGKASWSMSRSSSLIFANEKAKEEYVFSRQVYMEPEQPNKWYVILYKVENGKLQEVQRFSPRDQTSSSTEILHGDINGDGYDDWGVVGWDYYVYFYRGLREGVDSIPFAKYKLDAERLANSEGMTLLAIGDVTGDGVGDMALGYNVGQGRFSIIKGESILPVGVEEPVTGYTPPEFELAQNYPNPAERNGTTVLPVSIHSAGLYTLHLYDLHGRLVATLFTGDLPTGTHEISINLRQYTLSPGFYALRLTDGVHTRERGLLLR